MEQVQLTWAERMAIWSSVEGNLKVRRPAVLEKNRELMDAGYFDVEEVRAVFESGVHTVPENWDGDRPSTDQDWAINVTRGLSKLGFKVTLTPDWEPTRGTFFWTIEVE